MMYFVLLTLLLIAPVQDVERLWLICLEKNHIVDINIIAIGTEDNLFFSLDDLLCDGDGVITMHNHTNGNPTPSLQDRIVYRRKQMFLEKNGMTLHDDIVFTSSQFFSMKNNLLLDLYY